MNITILHNHYQHAGGEDRVFHMEADLLEERGHVVTRHTVDNDRAMGMNPVKLGALTIWNAQEYAALRRQLRHTRTEIVHVHNTLPLLSPSVYYAAQAEGAAVVQTLHNYRFVCPSGLLLRNSKPCELCVGKPLAWPGVLHACYRGSRPATATIATMLTLHRTAGTYRHRVNRYIALSQFAKAKYVEGGLPVERIRVKPNFLPHDPGIGSGSGGYALYVGRLSPEKGIDVLLEAWRTLGTRLPLHVIGEGPMASRVAEEAESHNGVAFLGAVPPHEVAGHMGRAVAVVVPSISYETFGLVAIEAFASGTPVIASGLGALAEIVSHKRNGLHFSPGSASELVNAVNSLLDQPRRLEAMRGAARREYAAHYTAEANYRQLVDIYAQALESIHHEPTRSSVG